MKTVNKIIFRIAMLLCGVLVATRVCSQELSKGTNEGRKERARVLFSTEFPI
jgi:hypothetical protein